MNVSELKRLCAAFPGASECLYGPPSNILVYAVDDKKFAYFKTSAPEQWRFSLRVSPDRFLELTDMPGIKPARYMGRFHWVTIVDPASMPRDYLLELLAWSYDKALQGLGRKRRLAIAAGT
ncbi:MAG TPA: MmcQ/YjbR family DNA-binding protein [Telluria sp.]|jgi:predicted DNA-binding protein (MmcQ/YjbR family)